MDELLLRSGKADVQSFDFAEPSFAFGLGDAGEEVVADLGEVVPLGGVGPDARNATSSDRLVVNRVGPAMVLQSPVMAGEVASSTLRTRTPRQAVMSMCQPTVVR